jgi:hypothetical protein
MAVANAAIAAAFLSLSEVSESLGTAASALTALIDGARVVGATGAKAEAQATMATRRTATVWQFFILYNFWKIMAKRVEWIERWIDKIIITPYKNVDCHGIIRRIHIFFLFGGMLINFTFLFSIYRTNCLWSFNPSQTHIG